MLVHNAKLALAEDYKAKERAREVKERIARKVAVMTAHIKRQDRRLWATRGCRR